MKMKKTSKSSPNTKQSFQKIIKNIKKFHYFFSISLVIIGAAFIVYNINDILNQVPDPNATSKEVGFNDKFDSETIKRIEKFKYRDETTIPINPTGRTNPFIE
jgi:hypothetical protein